MITRNGRRQFNGKQYREDVWVPNKKMAQTRARIKFEKKGIPYRIIKVKDGYVIYIRL